MKPFRVRFTPESSKLIQKLHPEVKKRVRRGIKELVVDPLLGHELQRDLSGFRSLRVQGYRVIYRLNDEERSVDVYFVGPRIDVYENFLSLLKKQGF